MCPPIDARKAQAPMAEHKRSDKDDWLFEDYRIFSAECKPETPALPCPIRYRNTGKAPIEQMF